MAFGSPITDGTAIATGTYGYITSFNLSTQEIDELTGLQVYLSPAYSSIATPVEISVLFAYPEASGCPNLAVAQSGINVFVFCKTSIYPNTASTRVAFFFKKRATTVTAVSDLLDIPNEARNLFFNYCMEQAQIINEVTPDRNIRQNINNEIEKLGLQ